MLPAERQYHVIGMAVLTMHGVPPPVLANAMIVLTAFEFISRLNSTVSPSRTSKFPSFYSYLFISSHV